MTTLTDIGAIKEAQAGLTTWPEPRIAGAGFTKAEFLDVLLGNTVVPNPVSRLTARGNKRAIARDYAPVAHFDARYGITQSGGFVSQWADISGNGRHLKQTTGANQPAYDNTGGIPSLIFNGSSHYMKTDPFTLSQPETIYLVAKQVSWTLNDHIIDGNSSDVMAIYQGASTPEIGAYAGNVTGNTSALAVGAKGVICSVFNGVSSVLKVNLNADVSGNAGASNAGGFTIGAAASGAAQANIQVYEALIHNVAHDAATRANVIRALMNKHNIT